MAMSYLPPEEQEQILVLTTKKPMSRWLQALLKILAVLLGVALVIAGIIGWRYYSVHQRLKKDLTRVIRTEEHLRSLGGINAAADLIIPSAPDSWRFRYLSSIRARKGRPEPEIQVQSVGYDGVNARVKLLVDGVRQLRHYQLYTGKDWRRAPFIAKGWGDKKTIKDAGGFMIIYWDEDESFAQALAADLPDLVQLMSGVGLTPASTDLAIVPREFDDLARPAREMDGIVLNSPHVDLIPETPGELSARQMLRLALAKEIIGEARKQVLITSDLPGAARVQNAIDDVLAWHWAAGEIPAETLAAWRDEMKGHWVSPATGLPPDLITQLPPDAPDAAARLMMTWLLRKEDADALFALSASLPDAKTWDEAYGQATGKTAAQIEQAARTMARQPDAALPDWPTPSAAAAPQTVTLLTSHPDASGRLLARTPAGDVVLLQPDPDAVFVMADGSALQYDCVAPGSQVQVQGRWLDAGLRMSFATMTLEQAVLPPALQAPAIDSEADALVWRYLDGSPPNLVLMQHRPGGVMAPMPHPDLSTDAVASLALSRSRKSPLLVWMASNHCNRRWLLAYDPALGVVASWLTPEGTPSDVTAALVPTGEGIQLFVAFGVGENETSFLTNSSHVLRPLTKAEEKALLDDRFPLGVPVIEHETNTIQLFDPVAKTSSLFYQPEAGDELRSVITAYGAPQDVFFFTMQRSHDGTVRVMSVSQDSPETMTELFSLLLAGDVTDITLCPDGSYLYGEVLDGDHEGDLRVHRLSGEDESMVQEPLANGNYIPVYCAKSP